MLALELYFLKYLVKNIRSLYIHTSFIFNICNIFVRGEEEDKVSKFL